MRDSAAQLWVSERESCGWGDCVDGGAVASMAWRVDGVTRARQWRGTSCEHAIAAARGGTRVGRGRACGLWVGPRRRARARAKKTAPASTSLSLLPQPPSSSATDAPQPIVCCVPAGCCFGGARARGRGFSQCDGCPLMLAACYSPRLLLLRGLVGGARTHKGQPRLGAKHSGWFPTSAAARGASLSLVWERWRARRLGVCCLLVSYCPQPPFFMVCKSDVKRGVTRA